MVRNFIFNEVDANPYYCSILKSKEMEKMFNKSKSEQTNMNELKEKLHETPLEKNDFLAMVVAAFKVFLPPLFIMFLLFYLIIGIIFLW